MAPVNTMITTTTATVEQVAPVNAMGMGMTTTAMDTDAT